MRPAPSADFSARWSRPRSPPGRRPSTFPTRSATPRRKHMAGVIKNLKNRVPNIDKATISIHCHNDLGLAVANSLAGVEAGAGQIECTMNGIGERAGNCLARRSRDGDAHPLRLLPDARPASTPSGSSRRAGCSATSRGMQVQRNKAIVGRNAFAHEAGIHQDGMLKERSDLRNHAARGRRPRKDRPRAGQAQRPGGARRSRARRLGYQLSGEQLASRFSTSSSASATRRRKSTTPTSRRSLSWNCTACRKSKYGRWPVTN